MRIGLPLDGWDLAVVDGAGRPVALGGTGELIIGGVGLARYLDADRDAEKYAAMPTLGWAGTAPTAAATWSGTRRRDWSSPGARTTRSSWAVDVSSSARSTTHCSTCRE